MAVVATTVTVMTLGVNTQAAEHHTEMMYASDHMEIASFAQLLQDSERTDEIVMENEYQEAGLLTIEELDKKIAEQKQAEKEAEEKACMLGYDWPGNVRELNAKIKRAVIVADNVLLDVCDLGLDNVDCSDNPDIRIIQEKEKIRNLLEKNHGNVSKTAVELGCSRTALYKKMKKLGLK